jgi:hypothetical protein
MTPLLSCCRSKSKIPTLPLDHKSQELIETYEQYNLQGLSEERYEGALVRAKEAVPRMRRS